MRIEVDDRKIGLTPEEKKKAEEWRLKKCGSVSQEEFDKAFTQFLKKKGKLKFTDQEKKQYEENLREIERIVREQNEEKRFL